VNIDPLVTFHNPHPEASGTPSTPEVLRTKECIPTTLSSIVFTFELAFESYEKFGGASHNQIF